MNAAEHLVCDTLSAATSECNNILNFEKMGNERHSLSRQGYDERIHACKLMSSFSRQLSAFAMLA